MVIYGLSGRVSSSTFYISRRYLHKFLLILNHQECLLDSLKILSDMREIHPWLSIVLLIITLSSCNHPNKKPAPIKSIDWNKRIISLNPKDSLVNGKTYLSVYSQINSRTEKVTHNLTATISMRNVSDTDTVYIIQSEYFDTQGESIRTYFDQPVFLKPLETLEIVIAEGDKAGGTGANFIFNWKIKPNSLEPLFEAVMISTSGQQGLSFTTQGKKIK